MKGRGLKMFGLTLLSALVATGFAAAKVQSGSARRAHSPRRAAN